MTSPLLLSVQSMTLPPPPVIIIIIRSGRSSAGARLLFERSQQRLGPIQPPVGGEVAVGFM